MTREEAIAELNTFKIGAKSELGENALDMAIEALKQESCGDTISRAEAMKAITDVWLHTYGNHTLRDFTDAIYNLSPVISGNTIMPMPVRDGTFYTTTSPALVRVRSEDEG